MKGNRWPLLWLVIPLVVVLGIVFVPRPQPTNVVRVSSANEELQAAAKEAQRSLPGFIDELAKSPTGKTFAIRGAFKTPEGPEYLWVQNPTFDGATFKGQLDQKPMIFKGAKQGDMVNVSKADVFDWLIAEDGGKKIRGRFTEDALQKQGK